MTEPIDRRSYRVEGLVQGVGFRPFVWRVATELELSGRVLNDGRGVLIELEGTPGAVAEFRERLRGEAPPLARIDIIHEIEAAPGPVGRGTFLIDDSLGGAVATGILPDAATCPACLAEIRMAGNRRGGYAFTNCTHCGPRFTIIEAIPYDRPNTTMREFQMCPDCAAEYGDPADRRFHAQPNACPVCGPVLWLEEPDGSRLAGGAIAEAVSRLRRGDILGLKGIGGFHLACDAMNDHTVAALRARKRREAKPFGIMMPDMATVERFCHVNDLDRDALQSSAAPLALMEADGAESLAPSVAPGQTELAVMLPYSPLHYLLMKAFAGPLVMTSANETGAPQVIDNNEARAALAGIADGFLMHDRPIAQRADDSVVRTQRGKVRILRRARGYAPAPVKLHGDFADLPPVLAMGPELKATSCLLRGGQATLTQHLGDLEDIRTAAEYERTLVLYRDLFGFEPTAIAVDLHPGYRSTQVGQRMAAELDIPLVAVQHHHAHIASVLAEAGMPPDAPPVLGIVMDGIGAGEDGEGWGCEFMLANFRGYRRLGSLRPAALPGGAKAMREPWRNLLAQLEACFGWEEARARWGEQSPVRALREKQADLLVETIRKGVNAPMASSAGRLFDAVAAALGIRFGGISFEGQAAMELEGLARTAGSGEIGYPFGQMDVDGLTRLNPAPMWGALFGDLAAGVDRNTIAARFHAGLAAAVSDLTRGIADAAGVERIALSGGVFQNRTLSTSIAANLSRQSLQIIENAEVPCNDGGVSLGQAVVAAVKSI
jgi:hydrogenase maturation protein HypF